MWDAGGQAWPQAPLFTVPFQMYSPTAQPAARLVNPWLSPCTLPAAAGSSEASLHLQLVPGPELRSLYLLSNVFPAELQPQPLAIILCRDVLAFRESSIFEPPCYQGIREAETGGSQIQGQGELQSESLYQTISNHRHAHTQEKHIFVDGTF